MDKIELMIKSEIAMERESLMFEILGRFGDRLPKDVQDELRKEAGVEDRIRQKLNNRLVSRLTPIKHNNHEK